MRPYAPSLAYNVPTLGSTLLLARVLRPRKWVLSNSEPHHHWCLVPGGQRPTVATWNWLSEETADEVPASHDCRLLIDE